MSTPPDAGRMKIGFFEAGLSNTSYDAGSTANIELCALLQAMGHEADYVYSGDNIWGRDDELRALHIPAIKAPEDKTGFLKKAGYRAVMISRPGPAAQWLLACEEARVPVIYFGHDIHHLRMERGNMFLPQERRVSLRDIAAMKALEQHIWQRAKAVIYPASSESEAVNVYCKKDHALTLPLYDLEHLPRLPAPGYSGGKYRLLFVGGAHHQPNFDAMQWFLREVWPQVKTPTELCVVGEWPESFIRQHPQATFSGLLSQEGLLEAYAKAHVVIAPLRYGAGVKRKVVEALALGRAVLSTEVGFESVYLPAPLRDVLCATHDAAEYAQKLDKLLAAINSLPLSGYADAIRAEFSHSRRKQVLEKAFSLL